MNRPWDVRVRRTMRRLFQLAGDEVPALFRKSSWPAKVIGRCAKDEEFKTAPLRFIDVLPSLPRGEAAAAHLMDYFGGREKPLPPGLKLNFTSLSPESLQRAQWISEEIRKMMKGFIAASTLEEAVPVERGHAVPLTILGDIRPEHRLAQEEVFGPVLALMKARTFAETLDMANSTSYALTGAVFSGSPKNLSLAKEKFRVGNLYLNRGCTGAVVARHPFGGFKMSGVGSKAGGRTICSTSWCLGTWLRTPSAAASHQPALLLTVLPSCTAARVSDTPCSLLRSTRAAQGWACL